MPENSPAQHHVAIVGGGFGGLFAAQALGRSGYDVTLLDKRNFHTFQPLLYQVASGMLTTGDVCVPHRVLLRRHKNVRCLMSTAVDVDPARRVLIHEHGELGYDTLIVATGVKHHYFGNDHWAENAPGLKTVEHALRMRREIFYAFERAEMESDPEARRRWLTFVVVGGGPTGVELAGAIGELAHRTMVGDFRRIDSREARIHLVEGADRILPGYPPSLSRRAERMLSELGVTVHTQTMVADVAEDHVVMRGPETSERLDAETVLWAAGVRASAFGEILAARTDAELDRGGRVRVEPDLSLPGRPDIFVIGDLARCRDGKGREVPGLAPAAIQQGEYVARLLKRRARGRDTRPFVYTDKGTMAVIGRNRAVADLNWFKISGFGAWLLWIFVHIYALIGGERRLRVLTQWIWKYFTRRTGDRLITGRPPKTKRLLKERGIDHAA
ncbi:FAD-dependent pyridine nucleotide-disulfide oxidoreductase [Salinisphaera sp. PC39]|uniref:NAD(P)/FAD-dependent oxidoreductase n=1 Tax=Salinisphaera sp. PC39 TaxID=1304156 RepID=UPI003340529E